MLKPPASSDPPCFALSPFSLHVTKSHFTALGTLGGRVDSWNSWGSSSGLDPSLPAARRPDSQPASGPLLRGTGPIEVCRKALLNQCNSFNYFTVPQGSCEHESVSLFPAKWGAAALRQFSRSVHAARNFSAKVRLPTAEGNGPKLLSHRGQALPRAAALPRGAEFCFFTTEPLLHLARPKQPKWGDWRSICWAAHAHSRQQKGPMPHV
ncbi:unnamed protein product [Effrenium voratum]|nr:unnamed protein product [Effrenium voratum]